MMKKKLVLLQVFVAIVIICTTVFATVSATIGVTVSSQNLKRGDTVTVVLSLKNIEDKVTSISGYVNVDENVLEEISYDSIVKDSNNKVTIGDELLPVEDLTNATVENMSTTSAYVGFNGNPTAKPENDCKLVIDFNDGIDEDTELLTFNFKVKSNATLGDVKNAISYSLFVVTAGNDESDPITKNVDLTISAASSTDTDVDNTNVGNTKNENTNVSNINTSNSKNENTNVSNTNTKNTNTNTNKNTNTNTNTKNTSNTSTNTNKSDNTLAGSKLPSTGAKILVIPGILLLTVAYVSYRRYDKYKGI